MKIICPRCDSTIGIRKILYGMPSEEPDPKEFSIGGCIFDEHSPTHECITCGWQRIKSRFVYDDEDVAGLRIIKGD